MQYKLTAERIVYPARQRLDHRALAGASGDNILEEIGKVTDFVISLVWMGVMVSPVNRLYILLGQTVP